LKDIYLWIQQLDPELVKAWGPIAIGLGTIIMSFIVLIVSQYIQNKQNKRQIDFNTRQLAIIKSKEERDEILRKLDKFYGPFIQVRTQSKLLYRKFYYDLEKKHAVVEERFRTLRYLLQGGTFTAQEEVLLKQILELNQKLLALIESSLGVVDRLELQDLFGRFGSHVKVLQLAYDKKLRGPVSLFEDSIFPLALDGAIESAIRRLKERLKKLDEVIEGRSLEKTSSKVATTTIKYYDENADTYANKTQFLDLYDLYKSFRDLVPMWGRILDAGCGVGRDTRYFIEHGYTVLSFDASKEMVRKCSEYPHAYCLNISFKDADFKEEFDGVWCCASLIHLTTEEAIEAMKRLTTSLKGGGIMFLSLKAGEGNKDSEGRFFQYYDESSVEKPYIKTI
jgi:ubiquinone/menaquinone biosynthesis C-methylase UbiE